MNLERVGGGEEGQEKGSKRETKAECKNWCRKELWLEDIAAYTEMFCMNCETFEEILTAIGPVITKNSWPKNYHTRGQTRKTIIDYHEEFEQAQTE